MEMVSVILLNVNLKPTVLYGYDDESLTYASDPVVMRWIAVHFSVRVQTYMFSSHTPYTDCCNDWVESIIVGL